MQEYQIITLPEMPTDWTSVPKAAIDQYAWSEAYMPESYAQLVKIEGYGFGLRMVSREQNPRAVYTEYNQPIYTDSCLEFFASWDNTQPKYLNMEMNANGALLSCVGKDRHERKPTLDVCGELPLVQGFAQADAWGIIARIPFSVIQGVYGIDADTFVPGYTFMGNFYKCGDHTEIPHYGSWSRVGTENPDFHRPEYFGKLVIA